MSKIEELIYNCETAQTLNYFQCEMMQNLMKEYNKKRLKKTRYLGTGYDENADFS